LGQAVADEKVVVLQVGAGDWLAVPSSRIVHVVVTEHTPL
jgi:hypothetical protein